MVRMIKMVRNTARSIWSKSNRNVETRDGFLRTAWS